MTLKKAPIITTLIFISMILTSLSSFIWIQPIQANETIPSFQEEIFDSPGISPTGLAWQNGTNAWLWNADDDEQKIFRIVPEDGNVVDSFDSPGPSPKGLTWDGQFLYNVDDVHNMVYKIDVVNESYTESFSLNTNGSTGITWDGSYFWIANAEKNTINKINHTTGDVLLSYQSPGDEPTGLAWDGTYLWNADFKDDNYYMIDPADGDIVFIKNAAAYGPWGLTWQDHYLWNADDLNNEIYKINISFGENLPPQANFTWTPLYPEPNEWVYFNASSSIDPEGNITRYCWDLDNDGEFDVINNIPTHPEKWETPGSFKIRLVVIDNKSFRDSITKLITIQETFPPTVTINNPMEGAIVNQTVFINGSAHDPDGTIQKVEILIGDWKNWTQVNGKTSWTYYWHTFQREEDGDYQIKVRSYNGVSYSRIETVNVTLNNYYPRLSTKYIGGLGDLAVEIKNTGDEDAVNVHCSIDVFGGFFGLIKADTEMTIPLLKTGEKETVYVDEPLIGLGPIDIDVIITADNLKQPIEKSQNAFVFGIFVFV